MPRLSKAARRHAKSWQGKGNVRFFLEFDIRCAWQFSFHSLPCTYYFFRLTILGSVDLPTDITQFLFV